MAKLARKVHGASMSAGEGGVEAGCWRRGRGRDFGHGYRATREHKTERAVLTGGRQCWSARGRASHVRARSARRARLRRPTNVHPPYMAAAGLIGAGVQPQLPDTHGILWSGRPQGAARGERVRAAAGPSWQRTWAWGRAPDGSEGGGAGRETGGAMRCGLEWIIVRRPHQYETRRHVLYKFALTTPRTRGSATASTYKDRSCD